MFNNDSSPKWEFLLEYCRNIVQLNHRIWRRNHCMVFSFNIQHQWIEAKILRPLVFPVGFFDGSTRLFSRTEGIVSIFFAYGYNLMTFKNFFQLFSLRFDPRNYFFEVLFDQYSTDSLGLLCWCWEVWKCARSVLSVKTRINTKNKQK